MWATTYYAYQLCPGLCPGEDTPGSPHIKTTNAGKVMLSIHRLRKRGHEEYNDQYSRQLVFVHAATGLALLRQYNTKASVCHVGHGKSSHHCETRCNLTSFMHPEMRELPMKGSSVFSTESDERQCGCQ